MNRTKIRAIAIDDEPIALDILRSHATSIDFLDLSAYFVNVSVALDYLKINTIDIVFLDINMPGRSGLDIVKLLGPATRVIFTTAYADFAVQGFELAAIDYLLKPISFDRFLVACERSLARSEVKNTKESINHIFIKSGHELIRIYLGELLFVRSANNYVVLYMDNHQIVSRMKLSDILHLLPQEDFIRVHKSYIVALSKVNKINSNQLFIEGHKIPVSRMYKKAISKVLKHLKT